MVDMQGALELSPDEPFQIAAREKSMSEFDKREEGFEKQFAHDEELRFKATARRNKMLGK